MKKKITILWLDDIRDPNDFKDFYISLFVSVYDEIVWVKNYNEFVNYITNNEFPDYIFFDHDLGEELNGYDCCKFVVDFMMDHNLDPNIPSFIVQSANSVGRDNIRGLINNYIEFYNNDCKKLWAEF